jgi:hypothetical protein
MNRSDILDKWGDPRELEKMYQGNKAAFKREFNLVYADLGDRKLADFWYVRLNYENEEISWGSKKELGIVIAIALLAGLIAKLPYFLDLTPELFYQRNAGFIFSMLTLYFAWKRKRPVQRIAAVAIAFLVAAVFINMLPADHKSDTLMLSCIHLPLFLWSVLGFAYVDDLRSHPDRIGFLRYNGELVIMSGLLAIAGGILTGITLGLFSIIGLNIEEFYFSNIAVFGLPAIPLIATHITQTNPQLVNKVSPVIAKIFSPLVLIMLVAYLAAILVSGKDPYHNRDFLLIFNLLLAGVMAIILFSVAETFKKNENKVNSWVLLALSIVTVIVNGIAISAILFRISEWGVTPNRIAILGGNILMLANLFMVTFKLFKYVSKKGAVAEVENSISMFLPVYMLWTIIVTFVFPFIFHFK